MNTLVADSTQGQRIRIEGQVIDGDGKPVPDAMIEIWQANAVRPLQSSRRQTGETAGSEASPAGAVRAARPEWVLFFRDDQAGAGAGLGRLRPSAAHQHDRICPRHAGARVHQNLLQRRTGKRNRSGSKFDRIRNARQTLIANRREESGKVVYRFDIRLQGENETVFFDV